jgi:UDP-N-acetylmuramoylalanine--D-glutamate ligase
VHNDIPEPLLLDQLKNKVAQCIVIGEAGQYLSEYDPYFIKGETLDIVKEMLKDKQSKGVLLFSPGYPSFDQFDNYAHRGRRFKEVFI